MKRIFYSLLVLNTFVSIQSCKNENKHIKDTKFIVEHNNIISEGFINSDSLRDGEWTFKKKGLFLAKGNYKNGLKAGKWQYQNLQYNNTHYIEWVTHSSEKYNLCLPNDWIFEIAENKPVHSMFYRENDNENQKVNGNITLIDSEGKNIKLITEDIKNSMKEFEGYQFLYEKEVSINNISGREFNQSIKYKDKYIYNKSFILKKDKNAYLISFFSSKKEIKLYNQLFTEIAYSFRDK